MTQPTPAIPAEAPKRIQLHRTNGWRKPEGAVVVSRPGRWGNPYRTTAMSDCTQELCPNWGGDGRVCLCALFGIDQPMVLRDGRWDPVEHVYDEEEEADVRRV